MNYCEGCVCAYVYLMGMHTYSTSNALCLWYIAFSVHFFVLTYLKGNVKMVIISTIAYYF